MSDSDVELTPRSLWEPVMEWLGIDTFGTDPCSHPDATVPASRRIMPPDDGLGPSALWDGQHVWINPPYSKPRPWLERARWHQSCCLVKVDPATSMWRDVIWPYATAVLFLHKRVAFDKPGNEGRKATAKWGSAIILFGRWPRRENQMLGKLVWL